MGRQAYDEQPGFVAGALLLGCFLSSFMFVSTMGVFYRSGKPLVAAILLALLFHVRHVHQTRQVGKQTTHRTRDVLIAFCLALFAGLLDREGFFYVLIGCGILGVHYWWTRELRDVLVALAVAAVVLQLYNFILAPIAIRFLNGYWPDFSYQKLPPAEIVMLPFYAIFGLVMMLQNAVRLFGGLPVITLLVLSASAAALFLLHQHMPGRRRDDLMSWLRYEPDRRIVIYSVLGFAPQVLMFALMIARHHYVYFWLDHRYWYYAMPYVVTLLFATLVALEAGMRRLPQNGRRFVCAGLLIVILGNLANLNQNRQTMREWPWFGSVYLQSETLRSSMRRGVPDPLLDSYYKPFFEYQQQLRTGQRH